MEACSTTPTNWVAASSSVIGIPDLRLSGVGFLKELIIARHLLRSLVKSLNMQAGCQTVCDVGWRSLGEAIHFDHRRSRNSNILRSQVGYLVDVVSKNGNLLINLINAGPRADGTIPKVMVHCLREVGQWLRVNGEEIYGTATAHP